MILLLGPRADSPLASVAGELRRRRADYRVVDVHRPGVAVARAWRSGRETVVAVDGEQIDLAAVNAAYLRPHPFLPTACSAREALWALLAWADAADAIVLNRPAPSALNASKPAQLQVIADCGFRVPRTIVTTSADEVRAFVDECGEAVYKSTGPMRSIVSRLDVSRLAELDAVAACPTQFQEYVAGREFRVHVVGAAVYPLLVSSTADDYRYARSTAERATAAPTELPPDVAQRIVAMVERMGLVFSGVDLRQTEDGDWVCLEVNPSPGFTFYERLGGTPLAPAVADLLERVV
jgi:glutathione synthase/RimK-type ligase-like ATP-grasp enzyme